MANRGSQNIQAVQLVDDDGDVITSFGGSGGTSATDDAAFTAASGSGTPIMGFVSADTVDSGDVGVVAMTTGRALHVAQQGTVTVAGDVASEDADSGNPVKVGGKYNSTKPTFTNGDRADLQLDSRGNVHATLFAQDTATAILNGGMNSDGLAAATGGALRVQAGLIGFNGTTYDRIRGDTTNGIDVDVTRLPSLPAGTNAIGKLAANSGVDIGDVDVTSIAAGSNLIGDVGIQGRTSGGLSIFRSLDLDETEEEVKATAGTVYGVLLVNLASAALYVKFYNATAANVTVGTTTPVLTIPVPADDAPHGFMIPQGVAFGTAITVAATTGLADNDTGAPGANEMIAQVFYK